MTSRRWCITDHDAKADYDDGLWDDDVTYVVGQMEKAPGTGKKHWQVYLHTKNPVRASGMRKMLPGAHIEMAKADAETNIAYCTKEESYFKRRFEYGTRPTNQGKRNDIHDAGAALVAGTSMREVALAHISTYVKYSRGLEKLAALCIEPRDSEVAPEVYLWVGKPGTGKSRAAHAYAAEYHADDVYMKEPTHKWWDGYHGQSCVIIDDYEGELPYTYLLRVLDRYPMSVETKGGTVPLAATVFLLTSNLATKLWYPGRDTSALERRIDIEYQL